MLDPCYVQEVYHREAGHPRVSLPGQFLPTILRQADTGRVPRHHQHFRMTNVEGPAVRNTQAERLKRAGVDRFDQLVSAHEVTFALFPGNSNIGGARDKGGMRKGLGP